ncbi:MAG: HutD family protein [Bacillota bacterium]|nr:HutD family protein [Bacillota bacterium]
MRIRINRRERQKESSWSGGKTLELGIFPETASYLDRDFVWRLSTADSDREASSFSRLPGYERILMVLEGDVVLAHGEEGSVHLGVLEQNRFDGGIKTRCFGRLIKDYNLIMARGCEGSLRVAEVAAEAEKVTTDAPLSDYRSFGVYVLEGYTVMSCGERSEMLRPGEQGIVDLEPGEEELLSIMGEGRCVLAEVAFAVEEEAAAGSRDGKEAAEGAGESAFHDAAGGSFFAGYGTCMRLILRSNKWFRVMRREGGDTVYYDKSMTAALRILERRYITTIIWAIGVTLCFIPLVFERSPIVCFIAAALFSVVHIFLIAPRIYWHYLPHPIADHMKPVEEMNAFERLYHEETIVENPELDRLMRRYKSDDEHYFADGDSILFRLVRKDK